MTIQIQEFENRAKSVTAYASRGLVCLKCGFAAVDFNGFCYHVKLCQIPVQDLGYALRKENER